MENCRYCGSEVGHAPSCPARPPEAKREHEPVPGFESREIQMLVGIVDNESRGYEEFDEIVGRTTPENLPDLIRAEFSRTAQERRKLNREELEGIDAEHVVKKLYARSSGSHAFQCSFNKAEDFGFLADMAAEVAEGEGADPAKRAAAEKVRTFASRQEKMNDLMTKLFTKDIALRIGDRKGDSRFFEGAMADFPALAKEVLASLDDYEKANAALVASNQDVRDQLANVRARVSALRTTPPAKAGRGFYGDVCMGYSMLVFEDGEAAEDDVVDAAEAMS